MGMTIDDAINYLIVPKIVSTEVTPEMQKQLDAHAIAIDIMHKYQKIEQILKSLDDGEISYPQMTYYLREVLEDGNNYI